MNPYRWKEITMATALLPMYYLIANLILVACFVAYQLNR